MSDRPATKGENRDLSQYVRSGETELFDVEVTGEWYKEGSSDPWRGGTYTAVVAADSPAEAIIEVLDGLGRQGHIESESGDTDWTMFASERELAIRVKPASDAAAQTSDD